MAPATSPPCHRRRAHRHTLTYVQPGHPDRRRTTTGDRCASMYLWCTAAFAVLAGLDPALDGEPLKWPGAAAYLDAHAADRRTGGLARMALATLARRDVGRTR